MDSVPSERVAAPRLGARVRAPARSLVASVLPLSLLEQLRIQDLPPEMLEAEDLAAHLPRRLGLTGVVETQIQRYKQAHRRGQSVPTDEVADLIRLVLRRPDAESILLATGHDIARRAFEARSAIVTALLPLLPRGMLLGAVRRAVHRVLRRVVGTTQLTVTGKPITIRASRTLAALVDASGTACAVYTGIIEESARAYTRRRYGVDHHLCEGRGDAYCEWVIGNASSDGDTPES